ncbi:hypothetical protein M569_11146 [Genlisea aurea]|uniref:Uncharacterized protein n=1 Tax=Genlisea aurea TaxID=192259 RepID=S8DLA2_9LAMI|nr:hypothetical protein M569_11146 [Genlisea aurea]
MNGGGDLRKGVHGREKDETSPSLDWMSHHHGTHYPHDLEGLQPVYDTDFRWGPPVYVGGGGRQSEGKIVFLQAPERDGGDKAGSGTDTGFREVVL